MRQPSLFVDPTKKCTVCKGSGRRFDHDAGWHNELPCLSCGGSGLEKDRPDPTRDPLPKGY